MYRGFSPEATRAIGGPQDPESFEWLIHPDIAMHEFTAPEGVEIPEGVTPEGHAQDRIDDLLQIDELDRGGVLGTKPIGKLLLDAYHAPQLRSLANQRLLLRQPGYEDVSPMTLGQAVLLWDGEYCYPRAHLDFRRALEFPCSADISDEVFTLLQPYRTSTSFRDFIADLLTFRARKAEMLADIPADVSSSDRVLLTAYLEHLAENVHHACTVCMPAPSQEREGSASTGSAVSGGAERGSPVPNEEGGSGGGAAPGLLAASAVTTEEAEALSSDGEEDDEEGEAQRRRAASVAEALATPMLPPGVSVVAAGQGGFAGFGPPPGMSFAFAGHAGDAVGAARPLSPEPVGAEH